jgi:hypothetical protein
VNIYRLNPGNRAQYTRDSSGNISFEPDHIPPCISPEQDTENRAQNEQSRRSGDQAIFVYNTLLSFIIMCFIHITIDFP